MQFDDEMIYAWGWLSAAAVYAGLALGVYTWCAK